MTRRGPWLTALALVLVVWEPLAFAVVASGALERIARHGPAAVALLVFRVAVTGLGIAAGRALWAVQPQARAMALAWLALASLAAVLTFATPYFPSHRRPREKAAALAATLAFNGAWAVYLVRTRRLRGADPVEG